MTTEIDAVLVARHWQGREFRRSVRVRVTPKLYTVISGTWKGEAFKRADGQPRKKSDPMASYQYRLETPA